MVHDREQQPYILVHVRSVTMLASKMGILIE